MHYAKFRLFYWANLLNKKSFNDIFLASAKHRRTIKRRVMGLGPSILNRMLIWTSGYSDPSRRKLMGSLWTGGPNF